ncbi:MAG TPA: hypothetical protein VFY71_10375 [Planctomycetota bacterium]|nr:hypothetical protein [Planctomycetota bacterium]
MTPFPISVGPLNWDVVVVAHETGHNVNALHTHDGLQPFEGVLVADLGDAKAGALPHALPVSFSAPAGLVAAQEWFKDTGPGYAATNGVRFELIVP